MEQRPNILFVIADDQSYPHAGAYGCPFVRTPAFDRIAREGVLFHNAYCGAPMCSPARAIALTGLNMWRLEEASLLAGIFPKKFTVFPDLLEDHGYHIGYTGKGWGPGSVQASGRSRNPAGPEYNELRDRPPTKYQLGSDYAANFERFLQGRQSNQPFFFWFGAKEPHRAYEQGSGLRHGKLLADVVVPPYLPDTEEVRSDLLDYALLIEWYDSHLLRMVQHLERIGELDTTLIIHTADNGYPFPRAKANLYVDSCHVPFALRWGERCRAGRVVTDFISFADLAPTICQAAGVDTSIDFSGTSLVPLIDSPGSGRIEPTRDRTFMGRERHTPCRPDSRGYPVRAIRTDRYHYVRNYAPDRWPVGDPRTNYADTDDGPTKRYMLENRNAADVRPLFERAFVKRPAEELYDIAVDPHCLDNVADNTAYHQVRQILGRELEHLLRREMDPRVLGFGEVYDSYPYFNGPYRWQNSLPGFKNIGAYNHEALKPVARTRQARA
jgi:N-sulfoglucosamine sulfohydrolase